LHESGVRRSRERNQ